MSDLRWNKIFGAVLATGLVILGLRQVSDMVFTAPEVEKPGYAIEVQEAAEESAAPVDIPPDWGTVLPIADIAAGQTVFSKCTSCHAVMPGAPAMTGPGLYGIVGRKPAAEAGFAYSGSMTEYAGEHPAWTYEELYKFLAAPQRYINGTKMTFVGLKKPEERINLIAWMRQQSGSPAAIPPPNPAAAAAAAAPAAGGETPTDQTTATAAGPSAAPVGTPANNQTSNPTGQTPASGAAAAPSAVLDVPGGKRN